MLGLLVIALMKRDLCKMVERPVLESNGPERLNFRPMLMLLMPPPMLLSGAFYVVCRHLNPPPKLRLKLRSKSRSSRPPNYCYYRRQRNRQTLDNRLDNRPDNCHKLLHRRKATGRKQMGHRWLTGSCKDCRPLQQQQQQPDKF